MSGAGRSGWFWALLVISSYNDVCQSCYSSVYIYIERGDFSLDIRCEYTQGVGVCVYIQHCAFLMDERRPRNQPTAPTWTQLRGVQFVTQNYHITLAHR